ncbi:MAG: C40 family peptidase [Candidatus Omnitrophica bacterium]|nr:C40 family peptidase [Candidatus Omnitrophota bacterium]
MSGCASTKPILSVAVPVVDLRAGPGTKAKDNQHDPLQESQLLYGERVRLLQRKNGWAQIQALEQAEFTHRKRWEGYPGWVPEESLVPWQAVWPANIVVTQKWAPTWQDPYLLVPSSWKFPMGAFLFATNMSDERWKIELSDGTVLWMLPHHARTFQAFSGMPAEEKRNCVLRAAELLVGDAYFWGGRSPKAEPVDSQVTGVDCSGLVNIVFRSIGVQIPRDAHEQFLRAQTVEHLQPADLIFLSQPDQPKQIVHVMLFAGKGHVFEAPGTGKAVHRISLLQRLGRSEEELTPGLVIEGQTVYFGSYIQ